MSRILVVDDSQFMRNILINILVRNGFQLAGQAGNGEEALEKYKETRPDVVFMDITMPKVDGITATKNITTYDKDAVVIMCSAMGQQSFVLEALKSGAKDFIVKPFKEENVIEILHHALHK